tara:strand:+ start:457 stop:1125 length:669 start_codon:yes stop_codon:yes gene_type:complete
VLTTKFTSNLWPAATLLTALFVSPLLSAQDVLVPGTAQPGDTEPAAAPAIEAQAQGRADSSNTPEINDDILFFADGAGSIEPSGASRITTLRDNVRFRQGLIEILGSTARLEQDINTGELIKVTVEGDPARFSRAAEDSVDTITGHSQSIVYYNETINGEVLSIVEFIGSASFNRGRTAFQCTQIKHVIETGATDSPGPCSGLLAPTTPAEQPPAAPDGSDN